MIQNEAQETVEKRQVNLLIHLGEHRFHHNIALALTSLPDVGQVVDTLTPFVHQERGWFSVSGLDPGGEQSSLVRFKEQELIQVLD